MNPYQVSQDPIWHRWVDGLVILGIGFLAGMLLTGSILFEEVTVTEVRRVAPVLKSPQQESGTSTQVPSGIKINEI